MLQGRYYLSAQLAAKGGFPAMTQDVPSEALGGRLTPRQREVLQLVAEGKQMKEIGRILDISVRTVEFHKKSIMEGLGLHSTAELTRYAMEQGIVGLPAPHTLH